MAKVTYTNKGSSALVINGNRVEPGDKFTADLEPADAYRLYHQGSIDRPKKKRTRKKKK